MKEIYTVVSWKDRQHKMENVRTRKEGEYHRDFTRIMYSSSFRRLQGKMQLLGINADSFFRNRLTHSLEVAQIARSIANIDKVVQKQPIESNNIFVVEAGALAHDIGNPPFGHAGEKVLDEIYSDIGGFEGNAQTLRILTSLERKSPEYPGLNLTYRTLLSVVKYFKRRKDGSDSSINAKFIYDDDYNMLKAFLDESGIKVRTLDVQIVDLADEIAYAAHDLEDCLRAKAFTMDEILHEYMRTYGDTESYQKLIDIIKKAREHAGYCSVKNSAAEFNRLFEQEISSLIINTLINDIDFVNIEDIDDNFKIKTGTQNTQELGFKNYSELADGLKNIIFKCVNQTNDVYYYEQCGNALLHYLSKLYQAHTSLLPPEYRAKERIRQYGLKDCDDSLLQKRLICDYIAGMMDGYAISTYEKYSGKSFGNILGDVKV